MTCAPTEPAPILETELTVTKVSKQQGWTESTDSHLSYMLTVLATRAVGYSHAA